MSRDAVDFFSGARGWDVAAERLGWTTYGVENWGPARRTAELNGFRHLPCEDVCKVTAAPGEWDLMIASPSCKKFSPAGDGSGRRALNIICRAIQEVGNGMAYDLSEVDPDARLVMEPLRIALEGMPRVIAWEQAKSVLPIWQECRPVLMAYGYSVAVDVLDAANYGVPQNRERAVLIARRDGITARMPERTHGPYPRLTSWVSQGEALGWPDGTYVVSNYGQGGDPRNRGRRTAAQPAFAVTGRADRNKVHFPDAGITGHETWVRNLTPGEAAKLQTFPDDYVWHGTKSEVGQQIGNAVPPRLAHAILAGLQ